MRAQTRERQNFIIQVSGAVATANTIAYISELIDPLTVFLELTEQNLMLQSLRYLFWGEGEVGLTVYSILVRYWEWSSQETRPDSVSYVPGDSLPTNPLSTAELRKMCRSFHRRFSTVPTGNALSKLAVRERTLASLDAVTGLRVNDLLALGWGDVNLENLERRVTRSIWHQVLGNCKAEASSKPVPMDSHMAEDLLRCRRQSI